MSKITARSIFCSPSGLKSRPIGLRRSIILRSSYVEEIIGYPIGSHLPRKSRQHVKTNVHQSLIRNEIKQRGTANHNSRKGKAARWNFGLLDELANDVVLIYSHNTAAFRVWNLTDAQGRDLRADLVKMEYSSQIRSCENIGIENPKYRVRSKPLAVGLQGSGTAKQERFFGDTDFDAASGLLKKFPHRVGVSMDIDEDLVDAVSPAEIEPNLQHRHTANRQQALGNGIGERLHPCTVAGCEQEGFHCRRSSKRGSENNRKKTQPADR